MKKNLSFKLFLLALVTIIVGCSDREHEPMPKKEKIEVTDAEIQGSWITSTPKVAYEWVFKDNRYRYTILTLSDNSIYSTETGTYSIDGFKLNLTKSDGSPSINNNSEIYFKSESDKDILFIRTLEYYRVH